jgi:hypothetical protein
MPEKQQAQCPSERCLSEIAAFNRAPAVFFPRFGKQGLQRGASQVIRSQTVANVRTHPFRGKTSP